MSERKDKDEGTEAMEIVGDVVDLAIDIIVADATFNLGLGAIELTGLIFDSFFD